jgi:hypothetical protein
MISLNHILLFIACFSPLVMLGQTLRRGGLYRPWRIASFAVLLVTAGAWLVNDDTAGFVGGGAGWPCSSCPLSGFAKFQNWRASSVTVRPGNWVVRFDFFILPRRCGSRTNCSAASSLPRPAILRVPSAFSNGLGTTRPTSAARRSRNRFACAPMERPRRMGAKRCSSRDQAQ